MTFSVTETTKTLVAQAVAEAYTQPQPTMPQQPQLLNEAIMGWLAEWHRENTKPAPTTERECLRGWLGLSVSLAESGVPQPQRSQDVMRAMRRRAAMLDALEGATVLVQRTNFDDTRLTFESEFWTLFDGPSQALTRLFDRQLGDRVGYRDNRVQQGWRLWCKALQAATKPVRALVYDLQQDTFSKLDRADLWSFWGKVRDAGCAFVAIGDAVYSQAEDNTMLEYGLITDHIDPEQARASITEE